MLDNDAAELLLKLAGGPRKQGDYVSRLIRAVAATQQEAAQLEEASMEELRQIMQGVLVDLAETKTRLARLEQK